MFFLLILQEFELLLRGLVRQFWKVLVVLMFFLESWPSMIFFFSFFHFFKMPNLSSADSETHLYAAMKALITALRCNRRLGTHMRLIGGYQLLSMILRKKQAYLSGHILQLILSYAGVVQMGGNQSSGSSSSDSSSGLNRPAFRHLVCDLRVWQCMPCDIQQLLYEQLIELVQSASSQQFVSFSTSTENRSSVLKLMFEAELPARLFSRLRDPSLSINNATTVLTLLQYMFCDPTVLLQFGQFLVWLIPPQAVVDETLVNLDNQSSSPSQWQPGQRPVMVSNCALEANVYVIHLRNLCLRSLNHLIFQQTQQTQQSQSELNKGFVDAFFTTLGPDWLILFLQNHLHPTTVTTACHLIFSLLADSNIVQKFREMSSNCGGGWLHQADVVIRARMGQLPGISVSTPGGGPASSIAAGNSGQSVSTQNDKLHNTSSDVLSKDQLKTDICKQPGFAYLNWLLPDHSNLPHIWFNLMGLFLGQPYRHPPSHSRFDTDALLDWALGSRSHLTVQLKIDACPEAGLILLSMARNIVSAEDSSVPPVNEYPQNLIQFFSYLFRNQQSMIPVLASHVFLTGIISILFPTDQFPRQMMKNQNLKKAIFDLLKSIYMTSLNLPPMTIANSPSTPTSVTSVASKTTSLLGGVAGSIGASVGSGSGSSSSAHRDSLTTAPLLDALLIQCIPEEVSRNALSTYRTELISILANSVTQGDVLANDKAVLSLMGNSYGNISSNIFAFSSRIVDVLWSGTYTRPAQDIFEWLVMLLQQAKRKNGLPLESLYRSLNRLLLFQLSRPLNTALSLSSLIRCLQTIHTHQTVIFGPENIDSEFVACLILCLLAFTNEDFPRSVNELDHEAAMSEVNETILSSQEVCLNLIFLIP